MRGTWTGSRAAAIAAGGALGAGLRWAVVTAFVTGHFPWAVLGVNVAGSVALGVLLAEEWSHPTARLLLHDFGGIGFCGGLTTFSTFSFEVVELTRDGHGASAAVFAVVSVVAALAGLLLGAAVLRGVRALTLPLEEEP